METFTEPKPFSTDPNYKQRRRATLEKIDYDEIDAPIRELIRQYNKISYTYSLQCCHGHFLIAGERELTKMATLPAGPSPPQVEYRIAYLAFCIENSPAGRKLWHDIKDLTSIDPENIQLGSAGWVWKDLPNFYAIQVEPDRYKDRDSVMLDLEEARKVERARDELFDRLEQIVQHHTGGGRRP